VALALIALPLLVTQGPRHGLGAHHQPRPALRLLALGLNIVVGFAGLLDLGYIAFYAVGAYVYALLASPHFGLHLPFWASCRSARWSPASPACCSARRRCAARRLPRHRHAGLRRDRAHLHQQPVNAPVNITNGPQGITQIDPVRIGRRAASKQRHVDRRELSPGRQVLLPVPALTLLIVFVINPPAGFAHRPRLGGHPRGRDRRQGLRHQHPQRQAARLRHGRLLRRHRRRHVRRLPGFRQPGELRPDESIMVLCMVVLGGMGNIWGVILGALLLAIVPELLRYTVVPAQQALLRQGADRSRGRCACCCSALALIAHMLFGPPASGPKAVGASEFLAESRQNERNLLDARSIGKRFGGVRALNDVSLSIRRGEIYGLIGPNGAGKTTFFNVLTGLYAADRGQLRLRRRAAEDQRAA
jgi:branched-chain amino acid transport system permease protein